MVTSYVGLTADKPIDLTSDSDYELLETPYYERHFNQSFIPTRSAEYSTRVNKGLNVAYLVAKYIDEAPPHVKMDMHSVFLALQWIMLYPFALLNGDTCTKYSTPATSDMFAFVKLNCQPNHHDRPQLVRYCHINSAPSRLIRCTCYYISEALETVMMRVGGGVVVGDRNIAIQRRIMCAHCQLENIRYHGFHLSNSHVDIPYSVEHEILDRYVQSASHRFTRTMEVSDTPGAAWPYERDYMMETSSETDYVVEERTLNESEMSYAPATSEDTEVESVSLFV